MSCPDLLFAVGFVTIALPQVERWSNRDCCNQSEAKSKPCGKKDIMDKKIVFVINDAPYGNERPYNAMRHAMNLAKRDGVKVKLFLIADAIYCARKDQKTPDGYYNIERMVKSLAKRGKVAT
jgi:hypothetical protein